MNLVHSSEPPSLAVMLWYVIKIIAVHFCLGKLSNCSVCGLHIWGPACSVTMCYLLSPSPSPLTTCSIHSLPVQGSAVPFLNLASRTMPPPHSRLLLHHTTLHQSPCFLSITVASCHLRERFNHLWPNPSFNDVHTLQGPPAPYERLFSQFVFSPWCVYTKTDAAGCVVRVCLC